MSNIFKKLEQFKKDSAALKKSILELEQAKEELKNFEQPNVWLKNKLKGLSKEDKRFLKNPFNSFIKKLNLKQKSLKPQIPLS